MLLIPLNAVPNQRLSFNVENAYWRIKIYQASESMCADVQINGNMVISGTRCFGGIPVVPFRYLTAPTHGNLIFDGEVDWEQFGNSCRLYYLTDQELAQYQRLIERGA